MMDLNHLLDNNKSWVSDKLKLDKYYFDEISKGQSPQLLYFGCSDSRVNPEIIKGLEPGDIFVHRNIANLVSESDRNSMSVLYYAVKELKIDQIVVCGHYECGGIIGAMQDADHGFLNDWLKKISDVKESYKKELESIHSAKERHKRLVHLNVLKQCSNIQKSEIFRNASKERNIHIYGWVFDIHTGVLVDLEFSSNNQ